MALSNTHSAHHVIQPSKSFRTIKNKIPRHTFGILQWYFVQKVLNYHKTYKKRRTKHGITTVQKHNIRIVHYTDLKNMVSYKK